MSVISLSKNYTGFDPRTIPGCQLWLDAADASSLTLSGTTVTAWRDKSESNLNFSTTSGSPTYSTGVNIPDGAIMSSVSNYSLTTNTYVYIVSRLGSSSGSINMMLGFTNIAPIDNRQEYSIRYAANLLNGLPNKTGNVNDFANNNYYVNGFYIPSFSTTVYSSIHMISGQSQFNGSTGVTLSSTFLSRYFTGNIYELIFYSSPPTTAQRQLIEGYLARKWGLLSSLPGTHPYKTTPLFTRPFQPTDILGCSLWLDAADASSLTLSGSSVTQWNDKSGNGRNATPYSTFGNATVSTGYQNNNNVLNFSGNNLYRTATNAAFYPLDAFIILSLKTGVTSANILSLTQGSGTDNWTSFSIGAYSSARWNQSSPLGARSYDTNTTETTPTSFLLMNWTLANNNFSIRRNTTTIGSTTSFTWSLPSNPSFCIGFPYISDATGPFNVYMGEIVIFNSVLSTSQRQQVEGYLANKWGLRSSLPSTQPFKLFPPLTTLFNPLTLSGCALWLDGADPNGTGIRPANGSSISTWVDKSGNGKSVSQSTTSLQPTYTNGAVNFGSNQTMSNNLALNMGSSFTCYIIFRPTVNGTRALFIVDTASTWILVDNYQANTQSGSIGGYIFFPTPILNNTVIIGTVTNNATLGQYNTNGNAYTTYPNTYVQNQTASSVVLSASGYQGFIYETVVYNSILPLNQRQLIEGYLASKWGLQPGLPSTHPFKRITP